MRCLSPFSRRGGVAPPAQKPSPLGKVPSRRFSAVREADEVFVRRRNAKERRTGFFATKFPAQVIPRPHDPCGRYKFRLPRRSIVPGNSAAGDRGTASDVRGKIEENQIATSGLRPPRNDVIGERILVRNAIRTTVQYQITSLRGGCVNSRRGNLVLLSFCTHIRCEKAPARGRVFRRIGAPTRKGRQE